MNLKKALLDVLMILQLCLLVGCDYIEKASRVDDLIAQQELQRNKIEALEKQQKLDRRRIRHFEKQQTTVVNSTKTLAGVVKAVKNKQNEFVFTEFNPARTQYFVLSNGSVGLAGKILPIGTVESGSAIRVLLVNLLSIPVPDMGSCTARGGEEPTDINALAKWQQLLSSTTMSSSLKLLPGQWQDINLTLRGVSPSNLKHLKLVINMANIQLDRLRPAESPQRRDKR